MIANRLGGLSGAVGTRRLLRAACGACGACGIVRTAFRILELRINEVGVGDDVAIFVDEHNFIAIFVDEHVLNTLVSLL